MTKRKKNDQHKDRLQGRPTGTLTPCYERWRMAQPPKKTAWQLLLKLNTYLPYDRPPHSQVFAQMKSCVRSKLCAGMFTEYDWSIKWSDLGITHNSMDKSWIHEDEWKKPPLKGHTIAFTRHSGKGKTGGATNRPGVARGRRDRLAARGSRMTSFWVADPFPTFTVVVVIHLFSSINPQNCMPERVNSTACRWDFKKKKRMGVRCRRDWKRERERWPGRKRAAFPLSEVRKRGQSLFRDMTPKVIINSLELLSSNPPGLSCCNLTPTAARSLIATDGANPGKTR